MSAEHLDMTLLGKEYRISCTPENRDELLATVAFLDDKTPSDARRALEQSDGSAPGALAQPETDHYQPQGLSL